jgi:hypothetical protein
LEGVRGLPGYAERSQNTEADAPSRREAARRFPLGP